MSTKFDCFGVQIFDTGSIFSNTLGSAQVTDEDSIDVWKPYESHAYFAAGSRQDDAERERRKAARAGEVNSLETVEQDMLRTGPAERRGRVGRWEVDAHGVLKIIPIHSGLMLHVYVKSTRNLAYF